MQIEQQYPLSVSEQNAKDMFLKFHAFEILEFIEQNGSVTIKNLLIENGLKFRTISASLVKGK